MKPVLRNKLYSEIIKQKYRTLTSIMKPIKNTYIDEFNSVILCSVFIFDILENISTFFLLNSMFGLFLFFVLYRVLKKGVDVTYLYLYAIASMIVLVQYYFYRDLFLSNQYSIINFIINIIICLLILIFVVRNLRLNTSR